jgi:hypothetical protein
MSWRRRDVLVGNGDVLSVCSVDGQCDSEC